MPVVYQNDSVLELSDQELLEQNKFLLASAWWPVYHLIDGRVRFPWLLCPDASMAQAAVTGRICNRLMCY